ncbi:hypothetical protein NM208_g7016 [Fusarium decemcellulare]|uniref:Uncharacterized protein n=1 Tax=Fusarium decemcellulare TaxID=57161 RepID=A0ACC1SAZ0_9HYPO|nr:hypothetical protein NM208_g7016 [Fusarium decemcellulare]
MQKSQIAEQEPFIDTCILPEWGLYYPEEGAIEAHIAARQMIADAEAKGTKLIRDIAKGLYKKKRPHKKLVNEVVNSKYLYMRQTPDGVIRAGCEYPGDDPGDNPEQTARDVFAEIRQTLVGGSNLEFDHYTIGYKPVPEDALPIIGPTGLDALSIAVMHSGVTNAAIVGELLSKQILTGETDPALVNFRLDRFTRQTTKLP